MRLRNQEFQIRAKAEKRRKLEIVLRRLTGDHLTAYQRQLISQAIGCREQCSFQLCQELKTFSGITDKQDGGSTIHQIFDDTTGEIGTAAAVLVRTPGQGGMSNTIYIYLPILREEKRDETQQEQASAQ